MAAIAAAPAAAAPAAAATPTAIFEPVDVFFVDDGVFCLEEDEALEAAGAEAVDLPDFALVAAFEAGLAAGFATAFEGALFFAGALLADFAAGFEPAFAAEPDFVAALGAADFEAGFAVDFAPVALRATFEVVDPDLEGCFDDFAIGVPSSIGVRKSDLLCARNILFAAGFPSNS